MSICKKRLPAGGSIAAFDLRRVGMRRWQLWCERYRKSRVTGSAAMPRRARASFRRDMR
jgi:hypothetical protein